MERPGPSHFLLSAFFTGEWLAKSLSFSHEVCFGDCCFCAVCSGHWRRYRADGCRQAVVVHHRHGGFRGHLRQVRLRIALKGERHICHRGTEDTEQTGKTNSCFLAFLVKSLFFVSTVFYG